MIRKSLLYIIPLIFLLTLLVLYQWSMYTYGDQEADASAPSPKTNVRITHEGASVYVEQSFTAVREGTYSLRIPEGIKNIECVYEEGKPCLLEKSSTVVTVSANKELHFTYELPFEDEDWISGVWFIGLERNDSFVPIEIEVSVIEKQPSKWLWMSPGLEVAQIKKDHIDFYQWEERKADSFPLYPFEAEGYSEQQKGLITFYSKDRLPEKTLEQIQDVYEPLSDEPLIVIVGSKSKPSQKGVIHVASLNLHSFKESWYYSLLTAGSSVPEEMKWLIDSVVAYAANTSPNTEKGKKIKTALIEQLTEKESEKFLTSLSREEETQIPTYLDEMLGEVKGLETSFFKENMSLETPYVPLYFYETKDILVNSNPVKVSWRPIKINGDRFYPLGGLATLIDMDITGIPSENVYIVRKADDTWRFSLNKQTYIENEESFGIASEVLIQVNKEVYIQERYMKDILRIDVQEGNQTLYIKE
ncbi:hypothetical protein N780_00055 [Pontibacillus chungwhensis BH030062]|uniref:Copper amine oxidase-like N-terminal domain-containing protein n=1 Tax=Pontibacillus chungwhensis BH030062 TaxID=1385513 RepID=A0A0A2UWS9_9BACI|nr:hypothetical protein [Pontibacillus chungwhensis]KGP92339.1 hypothetical protein N780_00055 [Pontibacillus chungwhensis BH030062]